VRLLKGADERPELLQYRFRTMLVIRVAPFQFPDHILRKIVNAIRRLHSLQKIDPEAA
jgi:hypothetical protein